MRNIKEFDNFKSDLKEEVSFNPINYTKQGYTKDDVETAFRSIEDDLSDYYSIDESSANVKLDWTLKYGSLDVESSLDSVEFEFDVSGFTRALMRNISQDSDLKGPKFNKEEIEKAIGEADYKFNVFAESINFNVKDINTTLEVNENRYSTELTVTGYVEADDIDLSYAKIDTDAIIKRIQEELLNGISKKMDFS